MHLSDSPLDCEFLEGRGVSTVWGTQILQGEPDTYPLKYHIEQIQGILFHLKCYCHHHNRGTLIHRTVRKSFL